MNWLTAVANLLRRDRRPTSDLYSDRYYSYLLWDGYYHNTVFSELSQGGQRGNINALLGNMAAADLAGIYNPVDRVVDLYGHVFGGQFGTDIRIEGGTAALEQAIGQIWQWSGINVTKQALCRLAANHGNVGLRIVARNHERKEQRRVYIKPEHPRIIRDVQLDDRGNVKRVLLEYEYSYGGLGDSRKTITIRELMTQERFQTWRVEGSQLIPFDMATLRDNGAGWELENTLGVAPYVLLAHSPGDGDWGYNAYYRAAEPINVLNALATHIHVQVHQHVRAKWIIAANGEKPVEFDFGGQTIVYVDTRNGGTPPHVQAMVANLSIADAIEQTREVTSAIEDKLPELKATGGKFLSGQSGETVAELRKPAEDKLGLARINYEDALTRAQKLALSWGVLLDMWELGTGTGTLEAAEQAYSSGAEDHTFNSRPLLPLTRQERNAVAAGLGEDVSRKERNRARGYSDEQIKAIETEREAEAKAGMALVAPAMTPTDSTTERPRAAASRAEEE